MHLHSPRKNIFLFRVYESIAFGDLFILIFFVPFFLAKGLPISEILLLQGVQSVFSLFFNIPSGYIADIWPRKYVLFASAVLRTLAYALMFAGHGFWIFALAAGLAGIGGSFHSGANSAFLYDLLDSWNKPKTYAREWGIVTAYGYFVFGIASLVGGLFVTLNPYSPALLNTILFGGIACIPLFLKEPPRSGSVSGNKLKQLAEIVRVPFKEHADLLAILLFGGLFAALAQASTFLIQYYLHAVGIVGILFGVLMTVDYLSRGVISHYAHALLDRYGVRTILVSLGIALYLGLFIPALKVTIFLVPFFLLISLARGMHTITIDTFINQRITSNLRATFLSSEETIFKVFYTIITAFLGILIQYEGISLCLVLLSIFSLGSLLLLLIGRVIDA